MAKTYMRKVFYDDQGNEISMRKHLKEKGRKPKDILPPDKQEIWRGLNNGLISITSLINQV